MYDALGALFMLAGFGIAVALLGFWVWGIVDAARRPASQWAAAGRSKVLWLGVILGAGLLGCTAFGWVGSLLYLLVPFPALRRAQAGPPVPAVSGYRP